MIQLRKTLEIARQLFTDEKIEYALIGGFALGAHGLHRATKDIDFLVDGSKKELVKKIFITKGFKLYHNTPEIFQFEGIGYVDILFANRPLSVAMLNQSKTGPSFLGVPVVSRESIIGLKIQSYKNDPSRTLQDKADIQSLLKQEGINLVEVKKYADLFNAWTEIEELQK